MIRLQCKAGLTDDNLPTKTETAKQIPHLHSLSLILTGHVTVIKHLRNMKDLIQQMITDMTDRIYWILKGTM